MSGSWRWLGGLVLALMVGMGASCAGAQTNAHTDPLNLNPVVRKGYARLYNLDYDGALGYFDKVSQDHPNEPMAWNYVLVTTIFRELYHKDLLDTTYYAHNSFLTDKREIDIPPATRKEIDDLTTKVIAMCDAQLKTNPEDKDALFARGYAKGMHAVFITLVDHSFAAAARQGYSARNDSEAVLKLDPQYADADMAIGIQKFAVASLPRWVRFLVGFMGVGGNKVQGLALLRESAAHGVVTSVESRTILSLFLRHDGRYAQALVWQHGLAEEFPHNYLFQLEVANLLKDEGQGYTAMTTYRHVLELAKQPGYFVDARLQLAYFGLADTERGYNQVPAAAADYVSAAEQPECSSWLRKRAQLNAGEMYDLLQERGKAKDMYYMAAAAGGDQSQADAARKYLGTPFKGK